MSAQARRRSMGFALKKGALVDEGDLPAEEENDDEEERKQRRKSKAPHSDGAKTPAAKKSKIRPTGDAQDDPSSRPLASAGSSKLGGSNPQMSNEQLSALYAKCMELCTGDKVRQIGKVAWNLQLIDMLPEVLGAGQVGASMSTHGHNDDPMQSIPASQLPAAIQGAPNFQVASVTLDASVKIYSARVDLVHTDTYKMLGGLNRTEADGEENEEDGDGNEGSQARQGETMGEEGTTEGEKKKKRSRVIADKGVNTLEPNPVNLKSKKIDMEFSVDPLFRKTSAAFDEGGASGLLLNHLNVYNGCEIIFDSSDAIRDDVPRKEDVLDPAEEELDVDDLCAALVSSVKSLSRTKDASKLEICPAYSNFKFPAAGEGKDADEDLEELDDADEDDDPLLGDDDGWNLNVGDENYNETNDIERNELLLDEELNRMAFPAAQQLGSAQFDYGGNDDDSGLDAVGAHEVLDSTAAKTKKTGKRGTTAVPDLDAILEGEAANPLAGDYSYFDVSKLNTWAGPQHWKFKKTTSNLSSNKDKETSALEANEDQFGAVATEAASSKKRGKKTKGVFMIDFMAPINRKELEKRFEPAGKVSTTLSKISLQSQSRSASSLTLGPDEGYEASMLTKLFSKPQMTIPMRRRRTRLADAGGNVKAEDGSATEMSQAVSDRDDSDNEGDYGGVDFAGGDDDLVGEAEPRPGVDAESLVGSGKGAVGELQLIPEPQKAQDMRINYAKVDKKIDVKSLKWNIWNELCGERPAQRKKTPEMSGHPQMKEEKSFHEVMEHLPNIVDDSTLREVSVPYCFVCLLHLANENHLQLDGTADLNDLIVKQTSSGSPQSSF